MRFLSNICQSSFVAEISAGELNANSKGRFLSVKVDFAEFKVMLFLVEENVKAVFLM